MSGKIYKDEIENRKRKGRKKAEKRDKQKKKATRASFKEKYGFRERLTLGGFSVQGIGRALGVTKNLQRVFCATQQ